MLQCISCGKIRSYREMSKKKIYQTQIWLYYEFKDNYEYGNRLVPVEVPDGSFSSIADPKGWPQEMEFEINNKLAPIKSEDISEILPLEKVAPDKTSAPDAKFRWRVQINMKNNSSITAIWNKDSLASLLDKNIVTWVRLEQLKRIVFKAIKHLSIKDSGIDLNVLSMEDSYSLVKQCYPEPKGFLGMSGLKLIYRLIEGRADIKDLCGWAIHGNDSFTVVNMSDKIVTYGCYPEQDNIGYFLGVAREPKVEYKIGDSMLGSDYIIWNWSDLKPSASKQEIAPILIEWKESM